MQRFVVHPRVETSLRYSPLIGVWYVPSGTEAYVDPPPDKYLYNTGSVLDFLLQYDFRGMNRFQEQENLEFLRLYMERYPEIREHFREDILDPTAWIE